MDQKPAFQLERYLFSAITFYKEFSLVGPAVSNYCSVETVMRGHVVKILALSWLHTWQAGKRIIASPTGGKSEDSLTRQAGG
jgi:hypothetical protein